MSSPEAPNAGRSSCCSTCSSLLVMAASWLCACCPSKALKFWARSPLGGWLASLLGQKMLTVFLSPPSDRS